MAGVLLLGCRAEDVVAIAILAAGGRDSSTAAGASPGGGTGGASSSGGTGQAGSQPASCNDSVRNQGESDVDCGGPCPPCASDAACTANEDCASGSCVASQCATTLTVYYTTPVRSASALQVRPVFEIHNDGTSAVPLSELEIRYFFTNEASGTPTTECLPLQSGCDVAQLSFGQVQPARPLADTYLSVSFNASAPSIAPGSTSGRLELGFRNNGIGLLDQSNDYSFDSSFIDSAASEKCCLYRNGKLIWGREPPP